MNSPAQNKFIYMIKTMIAPSLRDEGFKGSGTNYFKPDSAYYVLLGFQKSSSNTASSMKFTVNVSVIDKDAWAQERISKPYLNETPMPNVTYSNQFWQRRIGKLTPAGEDLWWTIDETSDTKIVADEVISTLRDFAFTAINDQIAT